MRQIRIFVSSPGDCAQERALLDEAVERINQTEVDRSGILLRTFAWENDVVPRIGPPPSTVIDEQTPLCDIYVGIMSARFGGDGTRGSGTEEEFRQALTRFGDSGKPWILFYFNEQPQLPPKKEAAQEWAKVLAFREELETKGIVGTYAGARGSEHGFFERIELHLRALLQRPEFHTLSEPTRRRGLHGGTPVVPPQYLVWLRSKCAGVDLFGLEPKYGSAARLQTIYVPLTTKWSAGSRTVHYGLRELQPNELLLDRFAADESLYIAGPPGSGKSTFCRWVTWLACIGHMPVTNLVEAPEGYRETWPTAFSGRLPVLVRLRECWQTLPARAGSRELSRQEFERCLAAWVEANCDGLVDAEQVLAHLAAGSALVVLDGVDEVPLVHQEGPAQWFPRRLLLSGLTNAMATWAAAGTRVLVTSRPYGLTAVDIGALGFPEARILDLDGRLRQLLVDRWFQQLRPGEEGWRYARDLAAHLEEHIWLTPLAVNPLLLTGMCIVFDEGGRLPQDKHELYMRIVNTVLNSRYRDDVEGRERARYRLQAIAYGMHTGHGLGESRVTPEATVSHQDLDRILRDYLDKSASKEEGNAVTVTVREELLSQSGLFLGRGDNSAGFYHLSFQEFLAGQRLTDVEDDLLKVFLERAEVPEWHNTLSLLFSGLTREKAARLVAGVVQAFDGRALGVRQVTADCLNTQLARGVRLDAATEQTCREAFLVTMLAQAHPVDRSGVASTLGRLGDPRFRVDRLCLPDEELLGFIRVDAGIFTMGSDPRVDPHAREEEQPQHLVELPEYYIARYPVTVAQFSAFVVDSGFKVGDPDCLRGVPNHPVVDVTFYEALAYCDWLTDRLTSADWTPPLLRGQLDDGWVITLPSEAEWEKAARGRGGRIYPWGHEFDDLKVNGDRTGLRATSSVGMFPDGASRCGALDMSGNVWECTRSLWRDERGKPGYRYPYRADDAERENVHAPGSIQRVMRGGAFYSDARDLRAATRSSVDPLGRHVDIGFRLVSSRVRR